MASTDELLKRIEDLEAMIKGAVPLPAVAKEYNDPDVVPGDKVYGKEGNTVLASGAQFLADCVNAPISSPSDMNNIFEY